MVLTAAEAIDQGSPARDAQRSGSDIARTQVAAGDPLGIVRHPFTGETLETITTPRAGMMIHAGAACPILVEGTLPAILGTPVDVTTP